MATTPQVSPGDRYQTHLSTSSLTGLLITSLFIFSTIYGLNYYFTEDQKNANIESAIQSFEGRSTSSMYGVNNTGWTDFVSGFTFGIDATLELIGIINPISLLVKPLILDITTDNDVYDLYVALNLFILRPIGWIFTFIFWEFIFNYIRGRST